MRLLTPLLLLATAATALAISAPAAVQAHAATAPTPTASATPSTELADSDAVTVTVTGFRPSSAVDAGQCAMPGGVYVCSLVSHGRFTTSEEGTAAQRVPVTSSFEAITADMQPWGHVDCRTVPGGCFIGVVDFQDTTIRAIAPIQFRATAPTDTTGAK